MKIINPIIISIFLTFIKIEFYNIETKYQQVPTYVHFTRKKYFYSFNTFIYAAIVIPLSQVIHN